jgi:hypothetical protein
MPLLIARRLFSQVLARMQVTDGVSDKASVTSNSAWASSSMLKDVARTRAFRSTFATPVLNGSRWSTQSSKRLNAAR